MSRDVETSRSILEDLLNLQDNGLDEDLGIALTSLVTTAVHDKEPKHDLSTIVKAVTQSGCASSLDPLTIIPIVVESADSGADDLVGLVARECSAKEVVMAVEEAVETIDRRLQAEDEEEDGDGDEDEDEGEGPRRLSHAGQIVRLVQAYSLTIPRLPKWEHSPGEAVESRLAELRSVISWISQELTSDEGRAIIATISRFALTLSNSADERAKELLRNLVEGTVETLANAINGNLARKAFAVHFSRLVVSPQEPSTSSGADEDALESTWLALYALGVTAVFYESRPSLASLVLLAHNSSYTFSISSLTAFFPIVLSSIQSNVALDEVLSILISTLAPLRTAISRPELRTDLSVPLAHLLPHIASNHSDPDIRHYTFRVTSLVLGLSSPELRFHLLEGLLADDDLPPQMRVAAVGLLKEAVLGGLSNKDKNVFASPALLSTFGPIVLRPNPPNLLDTALLNDFLESAEPLRLVECLGFYYVLLLRDAGNVTGVRSAASLNNVQHVLLVPLRARLKVWREEMALDVDGEHDHNSGMQLDILDMWVERVQSAVDETPL